MHSECVKDYTPGCSSKNKDNYPTCVMSDMRQATIFNHDRGHTRSCFMTKL